MGTVSRSGHRPARAAIPLAGGKGERENGGWEWGSSHCQKALKAVQVKVEVALEGRNGIDEKAGEEGDGKHKT